MNIIYSFSVPESLFVITLIAAAMFFAICILTLIDTWREIRDRHRQKKKRDAYNAFIQHKEDVERKARRRL